ncbi:MAG: response regulator [Thermodesulfobacteriota bacterium]|nr:response regulator [Thermodesulfobacteriota bacterium]
MMNKILIVDDDPAIRMLYADELSDEGYEVITCGDGSGLMDLIREKRPHLVVMDIRLGRYNGLDLLQDIRNTHSKLPVILCTAYPAFNHDLKSIAADYYVTKRSNLQELKSTIQKAIKGDRSAQSATTRRRLRNTKPTLMEQNKLFW